ncbi:hypothetical protein DUGA2_64550 [Duganella sp. HH101]|nr:hypothetical protein DUGA2_64550 [Duganella sp. HH101]
MRWAFADSRMQALAPVCWYAGGADLDAALAGARSVQTWADPHCGTLLPPGVLQRAATPLFVPVRQPCQSFSQWWRRSMHGIDALRDLPGLAAPAQPPLRLQPAKLLRSKWTAAKPLNREKHFIVTALIEEDPPGAGIDLITMEAVLTRRSFTLRWRELNDSTRWLQGWR